MFLSMLCTLEDVVFKKVLLVLLCLESEKSHKCPLSLSELFCPTVQCFKGRGGCWLEKIPQKSGNFL